MTFDKGKRSFTKALNLRHEAWHRLCLHTSRANNTRNRFIDQKPVRRGTCIAAARCSLVKQATDEFERRALVNSADTSPADGKVLATIAEKTHKMGLEAF